MDEADNVEAGAMQGQNRDDSDKKSKLFSSLSKIFIPPLVRRPKSTRSKTVDAVPHAAPELVTKSTEPIPIHNCRSAGAECIPGPSTPPSRKRSNARGSHDETRPDTHFIDGGDSTSTGSRSKFGSSETAGSRRSDQGTAATTPEYRGLIHRPGVIPDTSSFEENPLRHGPPDVRFANNYSPRSSEGTPAELVQVKSEEVRPDHSLVDLPNYDNDMLSKTQSQPGLSSQTVSDKWYTRLLEPKPVKGKDKGKAKQREYIEDVDGKLSKEEKRKSFDPPPTSKTPPMFDPGHDDWRDLPRNEKLKKSARLHAGLSTFQMRSATFNRRQPPVVEPIGPDDEPVEAEEEEAPRARSWPFGRRSGPPNQVTSNQPTRSVKTAIPTQAPDVDTSSLSSTSSVSGHSISDSSDEDNDEGRDDIPYDSARPSSTTKHYRSGSIDLEALNSAQVKAASYEKKSCSRKKKDSHDSETDSQDVSRCGSISLDGLQKLEMYRSNPDPEARFEICESPKEMTREEKRLSSICEFGD